MDGIVRLHITLKKEKKKHTPEYIAHSTDCSLRAFVQELHHEHIHRLDPIRVLCWNMSTNNIHELAERLDRACTNNHKWPQRFPFLFSGDELSERWLEPFVSIWLAEAVWVTLNCSRETVVYFLKENETVLTDEDAAGMLQLPPQHYRKQGRRILATLPEADTPDVPSVDQPMNTVLWFVGYVHEILECDPGVALTIEPSFHDPGYFAVGDMICHIHVTEKNLLCLRSDIHGRQTYPIPLAHQPHMRDFLGSLTRYQRVPFADSAGSLHLAVNSGLLIMPVIRKAFLLSEHKATSSWRLDTKPPCLDCPCRDTPITVGLTSGTTAGWRIAHPLPRGPTRGRGRPRGGGGPEAESRVLQLAAHPSSGNKMCQWLRCARCGLETQPFDAPPDYRYDMPQIISALLNPVPLQLLYNCNLELLREEALLLLYWHQIGAITRVRVLSGVRRTGDGSLMFEAGDQRTPQSQQRHLWLQIESRSHARSWHRRARDARCALGPEYTRLTWEATGQVSLRCEVCHQQKHATGKSWEMWLTRWSGLHNDAVAAAVNDICTRNQVVRIDHQDAKGTGAITKSRLGAGLGEWLIDSGVCDAIAVVDTQLVAAFRSHPVVLTGVLKHVARYILTQQQPRLTCGVDVGDRCASKDRVGLGVLGPVKHPRAVIITPPDDTTDARVTFDLKVMMYTDTWMVRVRKEIEQRTQARLRGDGIITCASLRAPGDHSTVMIPAFLGTECWAETDPVTPKLSTPEGVFHGAQEHPPFCALTPRVHKRSAAPRSPSSGCDVVSVAQSPPNKKIKRSRIIPPEGLSACVPLTSKVLLTFVSKGNDFRGEAGDDAKQNLANFKRSVDRRLAAVTHSIGTLGGFKVFERRLMLAQFGITDGLHDARTKVYNRSDVVASVDYICKRRNTAHWRKT